MHYSKESNHCRIDFFKPSGKWYTTEEVVFARDYYKHYDIHMSLRQALRLLFKRKFVGMTVVCLEPYHQNSHPIKLVWEG
jgi:hypothetical protein